MKPENVTEVIGFDLGQRETILARLRLDYPYAQPETIEIYHKKAIITAIGYHPTKGILIGEAALRTAGVTGCYIDFNKIPNNDPICQRAMNDFVGTIYRFILDSGMVEGDKTRFIVGYPTEWCKDKALVRAYEQAFSQAGIPNVTAIAESGAALLHAMESGIFRLSESYQPILLIDIGSAITNFFLVDVKNKKSTLYDVGFNLEAALIEKAIYQFTLENHPQKEELKKIFELYPHLRNRCEMICRKAKEDYFTNPHLYQESGDYVPACAVNIQNLYLFMPRDSAMTMTFGMPAALMKRLQSLRRSWKGQLFDQPHSTPWADLFDRPAVINFSQLGDDNDRAFAMSVLLQFLYEYRQAQVDTNESLRQDKGLRHLTVIEEAHRILLRVPHGSMEQANSQGKVAEMFSNVISEIRAYGEGLMIVDQVPARLVPDAIKNTNLKIVHRLVADDDRQAMGSCMTLTSAQTAIIIVPCKT
jgi:hypothetical protein